MKTIWNVSKKGGNLYAITLLACDSNQILSKNDTLLSRRKKKIQLTLWLQRHTKKDGMMMVGTCLIKYLFNKKVI